MLGSEYTWLTLSLLAILGLIVWKGTKPILASLDARGERIRRELEEAQALREEAQKLLADSKRRQRDAIEEAKQILEHARHESERMRVAAQQELEESIERRRTMAEEKIRQAETDALNQVRNRAVDAAVAAAARLIAENLDEARISEVNARSIQDVAAKLN
ncbi:MAG: F0F1 ATP synthase subunit B [Tistlia sp.]|uniref:F0F1 ATP synthase subunit B family protein n=1 Tax=Tistlia sp. TaxID=3057121 RepID=UPI0034A388C8